MHELVAERVAEVVVGLERVADGSMPCDAEWPQEQIALFRAWIDTGMTP